MYRTCQITLVLLASMIVDNRPALGQQFSDTAYGKRVLEFRQLEREILEMRIDLAGMLRVADELNREKPRALTEARMIVPRYDRFTRTLVDSHRRRTETMAFIATLNNSKNVTALRQKLEIEKRLMEANFKNRQSQNRQHRKTTRRRKGGKASSNARLQAVIEQQKRDKRIYDESIDRIVEQLRLLRGIESDGAPGGIRDRSGNMLHTDTIAFELVTMPSREKGRPWVEKQARSARATSTEERVVRRDALRRDAEQLKLRSKQLIEKAARLVDDSAANDLQELAELVQKRIVNPESDASIELTAPNTDGDSVVTVLRQKLAFRGHSGRMEFSAKLSPSLTLTEVHAPTWAWKFEDQYPMVHSCGIVRLWVGQFHIAITPENELARQASPGNRSHMLKWIGATLDLEKLAAL